MIQIGLFKYSNIPANFGFIRAVVLEKGEMCKVYRLKHTSNDGKNPLHPSHLIGDIIKLACLPRV